MFSQAGAPPTIAFDITKTDIDLVLKNAPPSPLDRQLRVVDMGKDNLGVGVIHRGPTNDKPGDPIVISTTTTRPDLHHHVGSGILTTGGTIVNKKASPDVNAMNGPSGNGTAGANVYSRKVKPATPSSPRAGAATAGARSPITCNLPQRPAGPRSSVAGGTSTPAAEEPAAPVK